MRYPSSAWYSSLRGVWKVRTCTAADRLKTASYGRNQAFSPARDEPAWGQNRRARFVIRKE
jgi:outer membrane protein OmpA-like peptidoglycan-associated protein